MGLYSYLKLLSMYFELEFEKFGGQVHGDDHCYVDLLSVYYSLIVRILADGSDWSRLIRVIRRDILSNMTIVIDGCPTVQKGDTYRQRIGRLESAAQKVEQEIQQWRSCSGRTSRRRKKKLSKWTRQLQRIGFVARQQMAEALRNAGFNVILAGGEADVTISREALHHRRGNVYVLTYDTDFFVRRGVTHVLWPKRQGRGFYVATIGKSDMLRRLQLTEDKLLVLGIMTRNDYINPRDYSKCLCPVELHERLLEIPDGTVHEMLQEMASRIGVDVAIYNQARDSFLGNTEWLADDDDGLALDNRVRSILSEGRRQLKSQCPERLGGEDTARRTACQVILQPSIGRGESLLFGCPKSVHFERREQVEGQGSGSDNKKKCRKNIDKGAGQQSKKAKVAMDVKAAKMDKKSYVQSKRSSRTAKTGSEAPKARKRDSTTKRLGSLKCRLQMVSIPMGTLPGVIARLTEAHPLATVDVVQFESRFKALWRLKQMAQRTVALFLKQYLYDDHLGEDIIAVVTRGSNGGMAFWTGVLQRLLGRHKPWMQRGISDRDRARYECLGLYETFLGQEFGGQVVNPMDLDLLRQVRGSLSRCTDMLASQLDTEFSNLLEGRLEQVANAARAHPDVENRHVDEIKNSTLSKPAMFLRINQLLPQQFRFELPESGLVVGFLCLPEQAFSVLLGMEGDFMQHYKKNPGEMFRELFVCKSMLKRSELASEVDWEPSDGGIPGGDKKYIQTNTIQTNGHEVKLLFLCKRKKEDDQAIELRLKTSDEDISRLTHIIGVDIGQTFAGGFCGFAVQSPMELKNFAVKSSALQMGERWFRGRVEASKTQEICRLEREVERLEGETDIEHSARTLSHHYVLSQHYNSRQMWNMSHVARKITTALRDIVINKVLHLVGEHIGRRVPDDKNIGIAIGAADGFRQVTSFKRHFIRKVRSLGYKVFFVDEYMTSQVCPRCDQCCESQGIRIKHCRNCVKWYHRDIVAAHNIADAGLCQARGENRPERLQLA